MSIRFRRSRYCSGVWPRAAHCHRQVRRLTEKLRRGATQAEIADCFGVATRTLRNWINQYPELDAAIQAGNDVFNSRVERALAERAIGFYADEYTWVTNPKTKQKQLQVCGRPPDVRAGKYWSKNRVRDRWRDVQEQVVENKRLQSSDEILAELRQGIQELEERGVQILLPRRVRR